MSAGGSLAVAAERVPDHTFPDEILADNVALLVRVRSGEPATVKSPEILSKIETVLCAD